MEDIHLHNIKVYSHTIRQRKKRLVEYQPVVLLFAFIAGHDILLSSLVCVNRASEKSEQMLK